MSISKDFTGYELLVPLIEEVKVRRYQTFKLRTKIGTNKVLQKMFDYMKQDMNISVDEYLHIVINAFSKGEFEGNFEKAISFLRQETV